MTKKENIQNLCKKDLELMINFLREKMIAIAQNGQFTDPKTIEISQKLDEYIMEHQRRTKGNTRKG